MSAAIILQDLCSFTIFHSVLKLAFQSHSVPIAVNSYNFHLVIQVNL